MRSGVVLALGSVLAIVAACTHDLDTLRMGAAGSAPVVSDGGSGGAGGTGGGGGGGGSGGDGADACTCDALPALARTLGFHSCCRGPLGRDCGITLGDAAVCLPRGAAGRAQPECPGAGNDVVSLDGCCRPDGRCGLQAPEIGCIAREELPSALTNASEPVRCVYDCEADDDCASEGQELVCTDDRERTGRMCARVCERDADCGDGEICGLINDVTLDRVHAVCQPPIGEGSPPEPCMVPEDCAHGVCLQIEAGSEAFCTQLCIDDRDCPEARPFCVRSVIPTLERTSMQDFYTCTSPL